MLVTLLRGVDVIAQEKRQYFHLYRLSSGDMRTRKRKHLRTGGTSLQWPIRPRRRGTFIRNGREICYFAKSEGAKEMDFKIVKAVKNVLVCDLRS